MSLHTASQGFFFAAEAIDDAMKNIFASRRTDDSARLYDMLGYFFGFLDEHLHPIQNASSGKRYRPALCLLIAEGYGAKEKTFDAALAIELFHNFTLIHDDIEDRDETRRGRPTLWKLFGVPHAINAGDALSLIAVETTASAEPAARAILFAAFKELIDGQHMDFELTSEPIGSENVTLERYLLASEKKTGALVGAAAEVAGICAGENETECASLRTYGRSLGIAHQLIDDYRSVWSTEAETSKDVHSDIREHKRTLPFFYAYEETSAKARVAELYTMDHQLSKSEIAEALTIIDATSARSRVLELIGTYTKKARIAADTLSLPAHVRATLSDLTDILVPEITNEKRVRA